MRWKVALNFQDLDRGEGVSLDVSPLDYLQALGFVVVLKEALPDGRARFLLWNYYTDEEMAVEKWTSGVA